MSNQDLSGSDSESLSLANNPRFIKLIEDSRQSFREHGGIRLEAVRKQLGTKRTAKRKAKRSQDAS